MNLKLIIVLSVLFLALAVNVSALGGDIFLDDYSVSYSYSSADEGERFTLMVSVTNTGSIAKEDVTLEVNDKSPFSIDDDQFDIGVLGLDETKSKSFRVDVKQDTAQGKYQLNFNLEDKNDNFEDDFEIEISSDKADLIIGNINSVPSILSPDTKDVKLEMTLENLGGGDANFVRAKLILPEGFSSSSSFSDSVDLGTIALKSSKIAVFYININKEVTSGNHDAKVSLEYQNGNDDQTSLLDFKIPIKGKPQYEVVSSRTSPDKVQTGSTGTLRITIKNIGEEKGEETSIRVFENADFPINFDEKTNFIGTIEKGNSGTATFKLDVDSDGNPNTYLIKIQIRTVQNGNVLVEEATVPVYVIRTESFSSAVYFVIGATVILAIILIYLGFRVSRIRVSRRKKEWKGE
jgi:hypothetical protein